MGTGETGVAERVDRQWFIVGRWQEYEGEARANVLRFAAIAAFYIVELTNYYGLKLGVLEVPPMATASFHQAATAVAVAWMMLGLVILLCLKERIFPASLKYFSTGGDLVFLTCVITLGTGPKSPLVAAYFVVMALAALRFSLGLVRFATLGSMAGYLFLLGYAWWFPERKLHVPRYHQLLVVLALGFTGIVLGQVIRRVHGLAKDYAARLQAGRGESA